ncbi:DUF1629 domain-containing protein [Bradyrhizobium sp. CSA207]|uniref:imm11 family protein n=1 Tax=Bradyrhizobium sp. CSA207 TaxID=2698826 RepID=UPI0023B1F80F|nr:DUF1629 domain-containing protein [Bradyrhizobium sp. CSA207]MDE5443756.1 DUF1629 domain-containing protein [Bradyrhizobium sp. CSA207]
MSQKNPKSSTRRSNPDQRKFYHITFDYLRGGSLGFHMENEGVLPDEVGGLTGMIEPPRFMFKKSLGRMPRDLEIYRRYWLISDRAKLVFESIDPEGFSFVPCTVRTPRGAWEGSPYWLCDVVRVLDALDESKTRVKSSIRDDRRYEDFGRKVYEFTGETELIFREEVIGNAHIFRMAYYDSRIICDGELKDACKSAGLKGLLFRDVLTLGHFF